jgi:hypothetical protein
VGYVPQYERVDGVLPVGLVGHQIEKSGVIGGFTKRLSSLPAR